jgi:hypothetical protein
MLAVALVSLAVSAEEEPMVLVYLNNGQCESYLRSDVKSISYESTDDDPSEVSIMRLTVMMEEDEDGEKKEVLIDYALAEVERVDFEPPLVSVITRTNVTRKYTQTELRGDIGGNWPDWPGVKLGFFISKSAHPAYDENRTVVYADQVCDGPGRFTYWAKNSEGYVGKVFYHYQAFAYYKGEFYHIAEPQSFRLAPVTMWTDTFAKLEKEDKDGRYYVAHVSADIFGDTDEIISEMYAGRAEVGFCYGPNQVPTRAKGDKLVPGALNEVRDIVCDIPHLEAGKKVWVRPYTIIADTIYYGLDFSIMPDPWMKVTTVRVYDEKATTAKVDVTVEVSDDNLKSGVVGVQYGTSSDLDNASDTQYLKTIEWKPGDNGSYTGTISYLTPNTQYYCRAYFIANGETYWGEIIPFKTKDLVVETSFDSNSVTASTALIFGKLPEREAVVEGNSFGFFYNTTGNPGMNADDPCVSSKFDSNSNGEFEWPAKNMKPNTTYYVCAFVTYKGKTYLGNTISFTTKVFSLKTSFDSNSVTTTTALILGELSTTEAIEGDMFGFVYNTTGNPDVYNDPYVYGNFTSDSDGNFHWPAEELEPNTTYYVCSFVVHNGEIFLGNTISFTTKEEEGFYGELGLFELKGHVKSCLWTNAWGSNTRTYDENGFWLTGDGWSLSSIYPEGIVRDQKKRITTGYFEGGNESWTIDEKGRKTTYSIVEYDGGEKHTYTYDANDNVVSEHVEFLGMDVYWNEEYNLSYSDWEFDSHGNWVKRTAYSTTNGYSQESRIIVYY